MQLVGQLGGGSDAPRNGATVSANVTGNATLPALDAVVEVDETGSVVLFNSAAEVMFGQRCDRALGKRLSEILVAPSSRLAHRASIERYLATEEARAVGRRVELTAVRADGTTFSVELTTGVPGPAGSQSFTGLIRDISARKHAEHFQLLVEAIKGYAIFMLDPQGLIASWNAGAQAFKGYLPEEILGRHFSIFYSDEDRQRQKPQRELVIAAQTGRYEEEGWRVRKDGSRFWANVLITAVRDGDGEVLGFAKVTRDLTERRKAERLEEMEAREKRQELEEENRRFQDANRLKSEFLANMSHELRTPLNAIIGFADLMFKGKVGPLSDNHKEYLGDILTSSRHLLTLINGVLDLAKIESGKMEFNPEPVDLAQVVVEVCDILRGLASTNRIRVEADVDTSIKGVVLDVSKLKQVLYNYLSNALKFTPEQGRVTIRVRPDDGDRVRIEVEDTGIGIRPEDISRLFVDFQQLDGDTAKKYAGTGLGLSLTKRIVAAQGGEVGVQTAPDKGSTFWAVLPRKAGGAQVVPASQSHPLAVPPPASINNTVLVIDDDPAALRLMGATMKASGYTSLCFVDPAEALRAIEHTTPAVVVLDLLMPNIDGFDLLDRLRAVPHMRAVPIVVWTVKDLSEVERTRLLSAAQHIVLKGHGDGDTILDAVRPYLAAGTDAGAADDHGR